MKCKRCGSELIIRKNGLFCPVCDTKKSIQVLRVQKRNLPVYYLITRSTNLRLKRPYLLENELQKLQKQGIKITIKY